MRALRTALAVCTMLVAAPLAGQSVKAGVDKWQAGDYKGAVTAWQPLAARGDADAMFNIGQAYKLGRGFAQSEATANDWFRRAANKGHAPAKERLGLSLYNEAATRAEGIRWLQEAAAGGQPRALYVLGVAHFNGDGLPRDWPRAYAYMLRASNAGIPQAVNALGVMNANIPLTEREKGTAMAAGIAPLTPPATVAAASATPPRPAATLAAASGTFRAQLGAFSQRALAENAWTRMRTSVGALPQGVDAVFADAGTVVRLQLGPFPTRAAATAMCDRVKSTGGGCFVVAG
jgi:TPR repeat protein